MKTAFKKKLIKALRSDKYEQTHGCLRDQNGLCALGVICDLYNNELWNGEYSDYRFLNHSGLLPEEVKKELNISEDEEHKIMGWNDSENGKTFRQIASYLERQL